MWNTKLYKSLMQTNLTHSCVTQIDTTALYKCENVSQTCKTQGNRFLSCGCLVRYIKNNKTHWQHWVHAHERFLTRLEHKWTIKTTRQKLLLCVNRDMYGHSYGLLWHRVNIHTPTTVSTTQLPRPRVEGFKIRKGRETGEKIRFLSTRLTPNENIRP